MYNQQTPIDILVFSFPRDMTAMGMLQLIQNVTWSQMRDLIGYTRWKYQFIFYYDSTSVASLYDDGGNINLQ